MIPSICFALVLAGLALALSLAALASQPPDLRGKLHTVAVEAQGALIGAENRLVKRIEAAFKRLEALDGADDRRRAEIDALTRKINEAIDKHNRLLGGVGELVDKHNELARSHRALDAFCSKSAGHLFKAVKAASERLDLVEAKSAPDPRFADHFRSLALEAFRLRALSDRASEAFDRIADLIHPAGDEATAGIPPVAAPEDFSS